MPNNTDPITQLCNRIPAVLNVTPRMSQNTEDKENPDNTEHIIEDR